MNRSIFTFGTRASVCALVIGLAIASCDLSIPGIDETADSQQGGRCRAGEFRCLSVTLRPGTGLRGCGQVCDGTVCQGCQCVALDPPTNADHIYACVKPDGFIGPIGMTLDDLSAQTNRNNITCVSKIRCNRT